MNAVRERRLLSDHEALLAFVAAAEPRLVLESQRGSPPDTYELLFRCRSVQSLAEGEAVMVQAHHVRIYLPAAYPAAPPVAAVLSRVAHPHVWPNGTVCLGAWNPAEKLDSVVSRIAAILVYDPNALNWRSVANEAAVPWAKAHQQEFPLDRLYPAGASSRLLRETQREAPAPR